MADKLNQREPQNTGERSADSLSERDQMLLMQFADGECSWFSKFRARRLLKRNTFARDFVTGLGEAQGLFIGSRSSPQVDLWSGIEQRILAEERAAVYANRSRPVPVASRGVRAAVSDYLSRFVWAGSGAAVAAGCAFFLLGGVASQPGYVTPGLIASKSVAVSPESQALSLENQILPVGAPRVLEQSVPSTFEVDWMRGSGRVRLYGDSRQRSPVIWVRRPDLSSKSVSSASIAGPMMQATALPTAEFPERFQ